MQLSPIRIFTAASLFLFVALSVGPSAARADNDEDLDGRYTATGDTKPSGADWAYAQKLKKVTADLESCIKSADFQLRPEEENRYRWETQKKIGRYCIVGNQSYCDRAKNLMACIDAKKSRDTTPANDTPASPSTTKRVRVVN